MAFVWNENTNKDTNIVSASVTEVRKNTDSLYDSLCKTHNNLVCSSFCSSVRSSYNEHYKSNFDANFSDFDANYGSNYGSDYAYYSGGLG